MSGAEFKLGDVMVWTRDGHSVLVEITGDVVNVGNLYAWVSARSLEGPYDSLAPWTYELRLATAHDLLVLDWGDG